MRTAPLILAMVVVTAGCDASSDPLVVELEVRLDHLSQQLDEKTQQETQQKTQQDRHRKTQQETQQDTTEQDATRQAPKDAARDATRHNRTGPVFLREEGKQDKAFAATGEPSVAQTDVARAEKHATSCGTQREEQ